MHGKVMQLHVDAAVCVCVLPGHVIPRPRKDCGRSVIDHEGAKSEQVLTSRVIDHEGATLLVHV